MNTYSLKRHQPVCNEVYLHVKKLRLFDWCFFEIKVVLDILKLLTRPQKEEAVTVIEHSCFTDE